MCYLLCVGPRGKVEVKRFESSEGRDVYIANVDLSGYVAAIKVDDWFEVVAISDFEDGSGWAF